MLNALRKRLDENEEGFTLIELMVVVLIIGILIAIAVPAFLGARDRANDKAAQADLRNGLTAGQTYFTDNQEFPDAALLTEVEPNQVFTADVAEADTAVWVVQEAVTFESVCLTKVSETGATFKIFAGKTSGTWYGAGEEGNTSLACPVDDNADAIGGNGTAVDGWQRNGFPSGEDLADAPAAP